MTRQAATTPKRATPLTTNDALEPMRFRARARTGWLRTSARRASNFCFSSSASGNVCVSIHRADTGEIQADGWVVHPIGGVHGHGES